jgi:uncharacterized membrane protein YgcG
MSATRMFRSRLVTLFPALPSVLLFVAIPAAAGAAERILDFHSDIRVNADASMDVTETIRVQAEGDRIKHGILRDFPTDYRDRYGNRVRVGFEPVSVEVDGDAGPTGGKLWRSERYANGVRVYFGDADAYVSTGEHEYAFRYRTTRQLGFFADHDELYWNVTGNGWNFAIDHASATVALPGNPAPAQLTTEAYTGPQGAKGRRYTASVDAASHAQFETTARLGQREGLTIVVGFPKGLVAKPGLTQQAMWLFDDNKHLIVGGGGVLAAFLLLLARWWRVGRDPRGRAIMPQYEAPEGFTPAGLRFVERKGYDGLCFASDLVDIGVRGVIEIRQDGRTYVIKKVPDTDFNSLPPPEATLGFGLLERDDQLELGKENRTRIVGARVSHGSQIAEQCGNDRYFRMNRGMLRLPMWIAVFAIGLMDWLAGIDMHDSRGQAVPWFVLVFPLVFILIAAGVSVRISDAMATAWSQARARGKYAKAILRSLLAIPGLLICAAVCSLAGWFAGVAGMLLALATLLLLIVFYFLLPAPTQDGRNLLDHIAGLRMYLGVAERQDLERMQRPQLNAREFERFLPYALALDVAKTWTDRFAAAVGPAAAAAAVASMAWYQGFDSSSGINDISTFSDNIGSSLSDAISSSTYAPGSSSGSSDSGSSDSGGSSGGDSGGGGGGGGGDGW